MPLSSQVLQAMRSLPAGSLDDILQGETALILAPHQDDETIGCGGLIAQAVAAGQPPFIVFVTDGSGSHPGSRTWPRERLAAQRRDEAGQAAAVLGLAADRLAFLGLRDTACPVSGPDFEAAVASVLHHAAACAPCVILGPWQYDPHGDHVATHEIAACAASRAGLRHLSYPVWGWSLPPGRVIDAAPVAGWRLDTSALSGLKRRALAAHVSQMTDLIDDDPAGFRLTDDILATIMPDHEVYLTAS